MHKGVSPIWAMPTRQVFFAGKSSLIEINFSAQLNAHWRSLKLHPRDALTNWNSTRVTWIGFSFAPCLIHTSEQVCNLRYFPGSLFLLPSYSSKSRISSKSRWWLCLLTEKWSLLSTHHPSIPPPGPHLCTSGLLVHSGVPISCKQTRTLLSHQLKHVREHSEALGRKSLSVLGLYEFCSFLKMGLPRLPTHHHHH